MSKQKISELVLARLKQKREEQIRNRPHYQVLRLQAILQRQKTQQLKNEIRQLQSYCQGQASLQQSLQKYAQQLDNTGKQFFPRIIIKPQFIATEKVETKFKQFYRKSANTFLRSSIQRKKEYQQIMEVEERLAQTQKSVIELEKRLSAVIQQDNRGLNKRRIAILKQQIRLRQLLAQQQSIKQEIEDEQNVNIKAVNEYRSKKDIVQTSKMRIAQIQSQINRYKQLIEDNFNPNAYRKYQQKVFSYQIKNQVFFNHLHQVRRQISRIKTQTSRINSKSRNKSTLVDSPKKSIKQQTKRVRTEQSGKLYSQSEIATYCSRRMDG